LRAATISLGPIFGNSKPSGPDAGPETRCPKAERLLDIAVVRDRDRPAQLSVDAPGE